jgi:hypothetical protein
MSALADEVDRILVEGGELVPGPAAGDPDERRRTAHVLIGWDTGGERWTP